MPVSEVPAVCIDGVNGCERKADGSFHARPGFRANKGPRVKRACEQCTVAKVRCSGSVPCSRCTKKQLKCEFALEKKRGRRTVGKKNALCADNSCWGQVILNPINKCEDFGAKFGLKATERRIFQVFFTIYKHHATPQSCCREWFSWQLNKMSCFLQINGNHQGSLLLDAWMKTKGIQVMAKNPSQYKKIPVNGIEEGTGRLLPPILSQKGPKFMVVEEGRQKRRRKDGEDKNVRVFSTAGLHQPEMLNVAIEREIRDMQSRSCFLYMRSTHECFEVEVNSMFTTLFGYTTETLVETLEKLFGGLLPWGSDLIATLLHHDADLLFFLRTIALKFNQIGRPTCFPATRQVISTQVFECVTRADDVVECLIKCVHREYLAVSRTEVEMFMSFEPTIADVPRLFASNDLNQVRRIARTASGEALHDMSYDEYKKRFSQAEGEERVHIGHQPLPPCEEKPGLSFPEMTFATNPNLAFLSNATKSRMASNSDQGGVLEDAGSFSEACNDDQFLDGILDWADGIGDPGF